MKKKYFGLLLLSATATLQAQWVKLNKQSHKGIDLSDIVVNGNRIIAVGTYMDFANAKFCGYAFSSQDGGNTWDSTLGPGLLFKTIAFKDTDTGFIGGHGLNSVIIKTVNGGVDWDSYQSDTSTGGITEMMFFNDKKGIACAYDNPQFFSGHFYTTYDGGTIWEDTHSDDSLPFDGMHFVNENTGYIIGKFFLSSHVLRTVDGGAHWKLMYNHISVPKDIHFWDAATGILCDVAGGIYKTTDSGATWQKMQNIYTVYPLRSITFINSMLGYCVGDNGTILKSTDGGETWNKLISGTQESLQHIEYFDPYVYVVGTNGTIMRPPDMVSVKPEDDIPAITISPNPADNYIRICGLTKPADIAIYDALGSRVLLLKQVKAEEPLDVSSLPAGIYKMVADNSTLLTLVRS